MPRPVPFARRASHPYRMHGEARRLDRSASRTASIVKPADAWIDPSLPVARALVTHGHADHARGGHGAVWATPETLAIMDARYGPQAGHPVAYGETFDMGEVDVELRPRRPRARLGADRARPSRRDGSSSRAITSAARTRPARRSSRSTCDVFVTEATFGLPVFRHPETGRRDRQAARRAARQSRALRAGRRLCAGQGAARDRANCATRGFDEPIYIHGALQRLCDLYVEHGVDLGELRPATGVAKAELQGPDRPLPALARSTIAGRGGCPIRSPRWRAAGCGCASARGRAGRAAADPVRSCRLGRADRHADRDRARRKCG